MSVHVPRQAAGVGCKDVGSETLLSALFSACRGGEGLEVGVGVTSRVTPGPRRHPLLLREGVCRSGHLGLHLAGWVSSLGGGVASPQDSCS